MKDHLLPAGFVVGKEATYVRRDRDQIHVIRFQGSKHGGRFTVNVGFSYAFTPPLFQQRPIPLAEYRLLDCVARARIGSFLPAKQDTWFDYGHDRESLIASLRLCATTCLDVFQRYAKRWRDPSVLLKDVAEKPGRPWSYEDGIAVAWIELRLGRVSAAETRLAQWSDDLFPLPRAACVGLRELLDQYQQRSEPAVEKLDWKDWVK